MASHLQGYVQYAFRYRPPTPRRAEIHERIDMGHDEALGTVQRLVNELGQTEQEHQLKLNTYALVHDAVKAYADALVDIFDNKLPAYSQENAGHCLRSLELARMYFNLHVRRVLSHNAVRHPLLSEFLEGCRHLKDAALWANRTVALDFPEASESPELPAPAMPTPVEATPDSSMSEVRKKRRGILPPGDSQ